MTTPRSSQEPSAFAAGESEQDSPAQRPLDDTAEESAAFESPVSDQEALETLDPESQARAELEELSAKAGLADEYLLIAQRTQADFENYRKRAAREAALAQDRGIAKLAKELLPAVDNLDRAVDAIAANGDAEGDVASGLKLVQAELIAALGRAGVERFSPEGQRFDPSHHEAVAQQPVEGAEAGTVAEVYQCGYRLGDAVIRPARVLVAG
jgi:molecular chaperone GrpE